MIPKFDTYHTALHSSFLRFDAYVSFLRNTDFSGYLHLEAKVSQYFIFFKGGLDTICLNLKDGKLNPVKSMAHVIKSCPDFNLSSYRCSEGAVDFFSRMHGTKILQKDISLDAAALSGLISLIDSKKVTGFLEAMKQNEKTRYVYFYNGKILGYLNVKNPDGTFEQRLEKAMVQAAFAHSTATLYRFATSYSEEAVQTKGDEQTHGVQPKSASNDDMAQVLSCYEEIMGHLESEIRHGDFDAIWRSCALELSETYGFLNPFAGEFRYGSGRIDLWDEIDTAVAVAALDALVNLIAKQSTLPKDGIRLVKDNYSDILVAYEIKN